MEPNEMKPNTFLLTITGYEKNAGILLHIVIRNMILIKTKSTDNYFWRQHLRIPAPNSPFAEPQRSRLNLSRVVSSKCKNWRTYYG